ncbi:UDP-glycosyltransferase UGT33F2, partial [Operophtera brumata]
MLSLFTPVCVLFTVVNGAKILAVWPTPSISHQVVFRPLTEELARRGHEVTVITTDPAFEKGKAPPNLREIDLHDLSYNIRSSRVFDLSTGNREDVAAQLRMLVDLLLEIFIEQLQTDEVKYIIENETFDLLLIEAFMRPALLFSHIYKVPVIQVSSFGGFMDNYERMGAPIHPLVYPICQRQRIHNLSAKEKVTELYNYYVMDAEFQKQEAAENKALRKHFTDMPTLSELTNNIQMLFLNVYPYWDGNRPVPPSVVYIGGIYQKPKKELPKLPYDIIWKWDKDELPGRTDNIRISKWLPQSDLLTIAAGVPLLGIPLLADQWYNAEKYIHLNIGVKIDMDTLNEKDLKAGIYTILDNADRPRPCRVVDGARAPARQWQAPSLAVSQHALVGVPGTEPSTSLALAFVTIIGIVGFY